MPSPTDAPDPSDALDRIDPVPVTVRFERHDTGHPWQPTAWRLADIAPLDPAAVPVGETPLAIGLHRDEAVGYYLNATSGDPSIFVLWRLDDGRPSALAVTLSYDEAGRWMDAGEAVDRLPMPPEMFAWLDEYVRLHYRPEQRRKRQTHRPSFLGRDEFQRMAEREARGDSAPGPATSSPDAAR